MYDTGVLLPSPGGDGIRREDIFGCDNAAQLNAWHRNAYDLRDETEAKVEARLHCNTADTDWLKRAAGFISICAMTMKWTERRLAELDQPLPVTRHSGHRKAIRALEEKLKEANRELRQLRGEGAA